MPFVIILTALVVAGIVVTMPLAELTFNKDKVFKLGTTWMKLFSKPIVGFLNLKIKVQGLENIPSGQKGSLILFKHTSHLDIPILVSSLPMDFRFGAKIELFKVPIFGTGMKLVKTLPIDRGDRDKVLALYKKSVPNVEQGLSYALAPEGTRKSMDELGGFVTGPFLFALQAQADILPVFISGAYDDILPLLEPMILRACFPVQSGGLTLSQCRSSNLYRLKVTVLRMSNS